MASGSRYGTHVRLGKWTESAADASTYQCFISGNANYDISEIDRKEITDLLGDSKTLFIHAPYCINLAIEEQPPPLEEIKRIKEEIEVKTQEESDFLAKLESGEIPKRGNVGKAKAIGVAKRKLERELKKIQKAKDRTKKDKQILYKSYKSLKDILVQINGLPMATVFHYGSRGSMKNVARRVMKLAEEGLLKRGCDRAPQKILGEVSAGTGSNVGATWEDLNEFYSNVDTSLIGLCLDTAHLYGSGMCDFKDRDSIDELFAKCDSLGVRVGLIHLNDSDACFGSQKDQHYPHLMGFWTSTTYSHFLSICFRRGIDVVSESAPSFDYQLMDVVYKQLPFVVNEEDFLELTRVLEERKNLAVLQLRFSRFDD